MKRKMLEDMGLEKEQIDKIMAENGNDIEAEKLKTSKAETERDGYKETLDSTQAELKKFEGLDLEAQKKAISDLQTKYDTDTKALKDKLDSQQYSHDAERYLSKVPFSSELARKAALTEFKEKAFKVENGVFLGADDWVKQMKESDPNSFVKESDDTPPPEVGVDQQRQTKETPTSLRSALSDHYNK